MCDCSINIWGCSINLDCSSLRDYTDDWHFKPAYNSLTGRFLSALKDTSLDKLEFTSYQVLEGIVTVAKRLFVALGVVLASAVDFVLFASMSVLVFPWVLFPKSHLVNLICSLANIFLGFAVLGDRKIEVDLYKTICGKLTPKEREELDWRRENELIQGIELLRAKVESQSTEQNRDQSEALLKEFIPYLHHRSIKNRYSSRGYASLKQLLNTMVAKGVELNHSITPNEHDNAKCYLIHYLADELHATDALNIEYLWELIEIALDQGADPHQPICQGRGISYTPSHSNLINELILNHHAPLIRRAFTKYPTRFHFDRPLTGVRVYDYGIIRGSMCELVTQSPVLYLVYEYYRYRSEGNFGSRLYTLLTLLDSGVTLSSEQEKVLEEFKEAYRYSNEQPPSIRLIEAMKPNAPPSQQFWLMNLLCVYKCPELFKKVLEPLTHPSKSEAHIQDFNTLFVKALGERNCDAIRVMLELLPLTLSSEQISVAIEKIESDMQDPLTGVETAKSNRTILTLLQDHKNKIFINLQQISDLKGESSAEARTPLPSTILQIMADYSFPGALLVQTGSVNHDPRVPGLNIVDTAETDGTNN